MVQKSVDISTSLTFMDTIDSPLGKLALESDGTYITGVKFLLDQTGAVIQANPVPECLVECKRQLDEYFNGTRQHFELDLAPAGTPFQQKVWHQLSTIPYGHTISYAEMARRLGDPKVIRAAGTANGRNPIAIIIPCHRVIGSHGALVGYAGGLPNKKWLLDHEMKHYSGISQLSIF